MRLLVSVVSAEEARRAVAGKADIVDVKDPGEGALGAPTPGVLCDVVREVARAAPVSVALGDLPDLPHTAALAARGAALSGADYVKVGLRGARELGRAVRMMRAVADGAGPQTGVIAVAYADAEALDPPALAPAWLPTLIERTGIAGALVDTFVKDGRGLYGWLSESELVELIARSRRMEAIFGVAGQLRRGELGRVAADVVGVRSAVCRGADRLGELDTELVAAAVAEVHAAGTTQPGSIAAQPGSIAAQPGTIAAHPGTIRVPAGEAVPGLRTMTVTPVRRTASGR